MRVGLLAAGLLLACAIAAGAATVIMSPPPAKAPAQTQIQPQPQPKKPQAGPQAQAQANKAKAKADCPCDCPQDRKAGRNTATRTVSAPRRMARSGVRRHSGHGYYRYADAAAVTWHGGHGKRHGRWRMGHGRGFAPGPGPMAYEPPHRHAEEGIRLDTRGWTGGVGDGGFVDGYGQVHFANGGGIANGPTYNSYGQSFPYNPSRAGPFQPRSMGGFAPPNAGAR